jgi:hypothetical protein
MNQNLLALQSALAKAHVSNIAAKQLHAVT